MSNPFRFDVTNGYSEEEFRAWKNEQASKWLKSLENALGEIGQGQILEMIRTRADPQLVFNWH